MALRARLSAVSWLSRASWGGNLGRPRPDRSRLVSVVLCTWGVERGTVYCLREGGVEGAQAGQVEAGQSRVVYLGGEGGTGNSQGGK